MSFSCTATVKNERGIHARPSALIAKESMKYVSEIKIIFEDRIANSKDVLQLIMLELFQGITVEIIASGPDEKEAAEAIKTLIETQFVFD